MPVNWSQTQPLGLSDLEPGAASRYTFGATDPLIRKDAIRCCARGCGRWLARRTRGRIAPHAHCPEHGISISTSPTYIYKDYRKNFIIDLDLLEGVKELKVESWRLGNERSEDALSWNCFVGLARLGGLASVVQALTEIEAGDDIELYLWGVKISDELPSRWDRLMRVRAELERGAGIPTEPDIILRVPGRALILIEAKFGSPNSTMTGHEDRFGAVPEFLDRYPGIEGMPDPLDRDWIERQPPARVLQQLVRNVIFAQWLADAGEVPYVVNLVRGCDEGDVAERFEPHLAADGPVRFRRWTWEELSGLPTLDHNDAKPLSHYLKNKTNKLASAFGC